MMRRACKVLFFVLVLSCIYYRITAQVAYHNFNTNSGLPSNETYCAYQDKQGYMWFGTDHGVVKYNGYTFETYTTADGLTDNTVFSIKDDPDGNIWFLTYAGGICSYNGKKFEPHPNNDTITKICSKRIPTSWEILDHQVVWLGMMERGFYKITPDTCIAYLNKSAGMKNDTCHIWVLTFSNSKFVYSVLNNNDIPNFTDATITDVIHYTFRSKFLQYQTMNIRLIKLPDSRLLLAAWQSLLLLSKNKQEDIYGFPWETSIILLKNLPDGKIWVSNNNGTVNTVKVNANKISLADSAVFEKSASDIFFDRQGSYWLTSLKNGIYMLPNINIKEYLGPPGLPVEKVGYMHAAGNYIYLSLPSNKLLRVDTSFNAKLIEDHKESNSITQMHVMPDGSIIRNSDSILHFNQQRHLVNPEISIAKIAVLPDGKYLGGGPGGFLVTGRGITYYKSTAGGFTKRVTEINPISANRYVIGTLSGLYYFDINNGYKLIEDTTYRNIRITACKTVSTNLYGVATRGYGVYLHIAGHKYAVNEALGLISNICEAIYFQNDSTLWVTSYQGLSKVNFKVRTGKLQTKIWNYTKEDGLCSNQINDIVWFNNCIWLATNEGVCYFKPNDIKRDTFNIPVYFKNIEVNGNPFSADSLNLQYFQNNLSIGFNALYYKATSGVRYKVKLTGVKNWNYITENVIQYYNLPAGKYSLQVAADDQYGRYKSGIKTISFIINPSFNNTIYFKLLIGLAILLIVGVIFYLVFRNQRQHSQNVIKLLQAEFKALNYQINPHFIFNVLNSIQYYIIRKNSEKAVQFLNAFSQLIRRIITNSKQPYISVLEEIECLQDYMDLEKLRLDNSFEYEINIDSNVNIEEKIMLPMILQPLVENSIWHGIVPYGGLGKIKVEFYKQSNALVCIVDDNGVGIKSKGHINKKSQNNLSLAMGNVNERLKIIAELNGSDWFINIEDKSDKDKAEHGTVVTIKFPIVKIA